MQAELVGLADQVDAEAVVWFLRGQLKPALQIDVACRLERVVGP